MITNVFNRKGIRKTLAAYKESVRQNKMLFNDSEIKELYRKMYDLCDQEKYEESVIYTNKINEIVKEKYPMGEWKTVHNNAEILVKVMLKDLPECKNINVMNDVVFKPKLFAKFLELAEQV